MTSFASNTSPRSNGQMIHCPCLILPHKKGVFEKVKSPNWLNKQLLLTAVTIVVNLGNVLLKTKLVEAFGINFVLRAESIYQGSKDKKYKKVVLHMSALAVLFLPYGGIAAVVLDLALGYLHYSHLPSIPPPKKTIYSFIKLDANIKKNAIEIFKISELEATDMNLINRIYKGTVDRSAVLLNNPKLSHFLKEQCQMWVDQVATAYDTLVASASAEALEKPLNASNLEKK